MGRCIEVRQYEIFFQELFPLKEGLPRALEGPLLCYRMQNGREGSLNNDVREDLSLWWNRLPFRKKNSLIITDLRLFVDSMDAVPAHSGKWMIGESCN